jgi:hypothetical protein
MFQNHLDFSFAPNHGLYYPSRILRDLDFQMCQGQEICLFLKVRVHIGFQPVSYCPLSTGIDGGAKLFVPNDCPLLAVYPVPQRLG